MFKQKYDFHLYRDKFHNKQELFETFLLAKYTMRFTVLFCKEIQSPTDRKMSNLTESYNIHSKYKEYALYADPKSPLPLVNVSYLFEMWNNLLPSFLPSK